MIDNNMIEVKYFKKGTTVYMIRVNKVDELLVDDVRIQIIDNKADVSYNLINKENEKVTGAFAKDLYSDLDELKKFINSQIDNLKKTVEQCGEEKKEVSSVVNT